MWTNIQHVFATMQFSNRVIVSYISKDKRRQISVVVNEKSQKTKMATFTYIY